MNVKNYRKATFVRVSALFLNALGTLVLFPFILRSIGENDFGVWSIAATITGYLMIADFGISIACTRFLSLNINAREKWTNIVTNSLALSLVIMTIMMSAGFLILVLSFFDISLFSNHTLNIVVGLLLIEASITMVLLIYGAVMRANIEFYELGWFDILRVVLRLGGLPLVLILGGNIFHLVIYSGLVNVLIYIGYFAYVKHKYKDTFFNRSVINKNEIKDLFNFGKYAIVVQVADLFRYRTDGFFIGAAMGFASVAHYAIIITIVDMAVQILSRFLSYWETVIIGYIGNDEDQKALDYLFKSLQIGFWLTAFFMLNFYIVGDLFITLWVGEKYRYLTENLVMLGAVMLLVTFQMSITPFFNGHGKQKTDAAFTLFEVIFKLLLAFQLIKYLGFKGIILATIIPGLLTSFTARFFLLSKITGIKYQDIVYRFVKDNFIAVLLVFFFVLTGRYIKFHVTNEYLYVAVMLFIQLIVYSFIYLRYFKKNCCKQSESSKAVIPAVENS